MTTEELRSKIEECVAQCEHQVTGGQEISLVQTMAMLYLADTIRDAAEAVIAAIEDVAPPGL